MFDSFTSALVIQLESVSQLRGIGSRMAMPVLNCRLSWSGGGVEKRVSSGGQQGRSRYTNTFNSVSGLLYLKSDQPKLPARSNIPASLVGIRVYQI